MVLLPMREPEAARGRPGSAAPAAFFLAFIPQFVDPAAGSVARLRIGSGAAMVALGLGLAVARRPTG